MKEATLIAVAALGLSAGAFAQGVIHLDDSVSTGSLAVDARGNWYSGTFGMEVWLMNSTSIPPGINLSPALGSGVLGYEAMVAAGFTREMSYTGQGTTAPGVFELGQLSLPDVHPPGAEAVLALAAWNSSAPSWSAMLASANQSTRAGIIAFDQPTTDPALFNGVPAPLTMSEDLVLSPIPEPSPLALAALGGALLSLSRLRWRLERRKDELRTENL